MKPFVLSAVFAVLCFAGDGRGVVGSGHAGRRTPVRAPGSQPGAFGGVGNVVFPGTGHPPPFRPVIPNPFGPNASFADRLGATISGSPAWTGAPVGGRGFNNGGPMLWPYPYPLYYGGYGYDTYGPQQQPSTVVVVPPQQAAPPVVINQNAPEPARPMVQDYNWEGGGGQPQQEAADVQVYQVPPHPQPAQRDEQPIFLLGLNDGSVYSAVAYWVEDGTLHYVTPQGKHNHVSLSLVDRGVTDRLNRGRQVQMHLPMAK